MLRTYFLISCKLDYCHSINLINTIGSSSSHHGGRNLSFYKYISFALLVVTFSLVIYIIITEFLRLKSLHQDLKIACQIPSEETSKFWAYKHLHTPLGYFGSTVPLRQTFGLFQISHATFLAWSCTRRGSKKFVHL